MACISPITLKNEQVVPCGYCRHCLQLKRMDWCFRLSEEQRVSRSSYFLTLTYAEDPGDLVPKDLQDWLKRLRRFQDGCYDGLLPVRYYNVGEYGERTGRAHYHSIIFNLIPDTVLALPRLWGHGHVHVGKVSEASIGYVTSYVINRFNSPGREPPFATMSKKPGLGNCYLTPSMVEFHRDGNVDFVSRNGRKAHMARYYRDRIFSADQRLSLRQSQMVEIERVYELEIERLRAFHVNPYWYYDERRRYSESVIGSQLNYIL